MSLGVELARSPRRGLSWRAKELIVQQTPAKVVDRLEERKSRETKEVVDVVLTPQERSQHERESNDAISSQTRQLMLLVAL